MSESGPLLNEEFTGTRRYTPTRVLGAGSWGRVYQAYDNERNAFVAVKLLSRFSPEGLLRFKREFRALQNVVHPNLVTLYELLSVDERWFFTMEYVDGKTFVDHVLGDGHDAGSALPSSSSSTSGHPTLNMRAGIETRSIGLPSASLSAPSTPEPAPATRSIRPPLSSGALLRLRLALGQLVDGVCALHAAGKLHRDLKPSNVLVTKEGRVVVLDFGLVRELDDSDAHQSGGLVVGTPAYMSPEQGVGLPVKESTDWYAVGVLLYELLTGQVPFEGKPGEMMRKRREVLVPPPSDFTERLPGDLEALCIELLSKDPESRPSGPELQKRLARPVRPQIANPMPELAGADLAGRDGMLEQLRGAFTHLVKKNQLALSLIEGDSGLGKSALLKTHLQAIERQFPEAVVLWGRCGETETVPFKAFDGVIDELCTTLSARPASQVEAVIPRDFDALVKLFPVLKRLEPLVNKRRVPAEAGDAQETRRKGFRALAELLARLSERGPVVIAIDDLQWGDADSAAMLEALLQPPDAPAVHVIASTRTVATDGPSPVMKAFLDASHASTVTGRALVQRLTVWPLEPVDAEALAKRLLPESATAAQASAVAAESRGSPYLIEALARMAGAGAATVSAATLEGWVKARVEALPVPARRLLEFVAVANRPIPRLVAWHAAALDAEVADPLVPLKAARLLSGSGAGADEKLRVYDERIGRAVREQLTAARRNQILTELAQALESHGGADAETLADWWEEAGQLERAWRSAERAAAQATEVLAFERAVRLLDKAINAAPAEEQTRLKTQRAGALASAGNGAAAAEAYLALARAPSPTGVETSVTRRRSLELRQRATEQLLYTGRIDEGIAVLDSVMEELGEHRPSSARRAKLDAVVARARVKLRGLKFELRTEAQIDPDQLARVDAYWAAAKGFSIVDPVRGTAYQFTHLRLALDVGEPYRVARALALEAGYHATIGLPNAGDCREALARLRELLAKHPNAHGEGLAALMSGCLPMGIGRFGEARVLHERAVSIFREKCPGMTWELNTSMQYLVLSLTYLGELAEVRRLVQESREIAAARNDIYALTNFRVRSGPWLALVDDQPEAAEREVREALSSFSHDGYFLQHFWGWHGALLATLYRGDHLGARARFEKEVRAVKDSGLLRIQIVRVIHAWLDGITALAADQLQPARLAAKALEKEGLAWSRAQASLLSGVIAHREGDTGRALAFLNTGIDQFEASGVRLHANAAKLWSAKLVAPAEQESVRAPAIAWFIVRGVKRPEAFAHALLPFERTL